MSGSFKDLLQKAGLEPSDTKDEPADEGAAPEEPEEEVGYAEKVVVRYQRKGAGGRKITRIAGVTSGRERLLDDLKRELGCGGRVDGDDVIVQGDQTERVARWLESRGAKKVVRGR